MNPYEEILCLETCPSIDHGGFLEMRNGELCLRCHDTVIFTGDKYILTRKWQPPEGRPWDTEIYEVKK
jgi:hypothetical protein